MLFDESQSKRETLPLGYSESTQRQLGEIRQWLASLKKELTEELINHLRVFQLELHQFLTVVQYARDNAPVPISSLAKFTNPVDKTLSLDAFLAAFNFQSSFVLGNLDRVKLPFSDTVLTDFEAAQYVPELLSSELYLSLQVMWTNSHFVSRELILLLGILTQRLSNISALLGDIPYELYLPERRKISRWALMHRVLLFQLLETPKVLFFFPSSSSLFIHACSDLNFPFRFLLLMRESHRSDC